MWDLLTGLFYSIICCRSGFLCIRRVAVQPSECSIPWGIGWFPSIIPGVQNSRRSLEELAGDAILCRCKNESLQIFVGRMCCVPTSDELLRLLKE